MPSKEVNFAEYRSLTDEQRHIIRDTARKIVACEKSKATPILSDKWNIEWPVIDDDIEPNVVIK